MNVLIKIKYCGNGRENAHVGKLFYSKLRLLVDIESHQILWSI